MPYLDALLCRGQRSAIAFHIGGGIEGFSRHGNIPRMPICISIWFVPLSKLMASVLAFALFTISCTGSGLYTTQL